MTRTGVPSQLRWSAPSEVKAMNKPLVLLLLSLAIIACVSKAPAQSTASGRLRVDVAVRSVHVRGDTIEIAHIVHNRRASRDSLFIFIVDARSGVLHMRRPEPVRNWAADPDFGGRPMVFWTILQLLLPDSTIRRSTTNRSAFPVLPSIGSAGTNIQKAGRMMSQIRTYPLRIH